MTLLLSLTSRWSMQLATAKPLKAEVQLVHVVSKENQIHEANEKLASIVEKYVSSGVKIVPNVRIGNIFLKTLEILLLNTRLSLYLWVHMVLMDGSMLLEVSRFKSGYQLIRSVYHCSRKNG